MTDGGPPFVWLQLLLLLRLLLQHPGLPVLLVLIDRRGISQGTGGLTVAH